MRRNAVHIEDRCVAGGAPEDRAVADALAMLVDGQRAVRLLAGWKAHEATVPDSRIQGPDAGGGR
jgi:hypothetical protein